MVVEWLIFNLENEIVSENIWQIHHFTYKLITIQKKKVFKQVDFF